MIFFKTSSPKSKKMKYTYRRGFFWLFVFFLLSLVPLGIGLMGEIPEHRGFWIELGVSLGFIGLAMMGLQFLFSGRIAKIAPTYGMDNIIQFHKEIGIIALLFVMAHPIILILAENEFLSYFDPSVNLMRTIALVFVSFALLGIVATSLWRVTFKLEYEKWRLLHGFLALSIVFIGIVHSIQVSHYLEPLWKKISIAGIMGASMYLVIHTRIIRPWLMRKNPYRLVEVKEEIGDCYTISLNPLRKDRMRFFPGQFAWITIGPTPFSLQQHPFSIASSPRSKLISFTAKASGDFTGTWKDLKTGTKAYLEGPFGSFTPEINHDLFFIMGGIGVTPAMSMLRTMRMDKDQRNAILIYANKSWDEVTYREELDEISKEINLKIVHLLEEPDEGWKGEKGLVTKELLSKYLPAKDEKYMYFICGPNPMMDIAEISLADLGIDWRLIYAERFEIV